MAAFDSLVAGAGIWGCTVARRLAESGRKVLVLDKRGAVGGNVRCETDAKTGIEVHVYGSHIFHTHIPEVWDFINRFVRFNGYQHKVLARHAGQTYFLPVGLALVNKLFGVELTPGELSAFMSDDAHRQTVFDAFFKNYTAKQWGIPADQVDPAFIRRAPVRSTSAVNYFNDYNQGIPLTGYNSLFERMLDHPNIQVKTRSVLQLENGEFFILDEKNKTSDPLSKSDSGLQIFYSGPVDALFGYRFGALPWRTLRFESERLPVSDAQGTAVVNYVDADVPYTRQHEYKHYHPERADVMAHPETIVCREFSAAWREGDEPYYPVDTADSRALLARYQSEVEKINLHSRTSTQDSNFSLTVGGRLGGYKYYDMDRTDRKSTRLNSSHQIRSYAV